MTVAPRPRFTLLLVASALAVAGGSPRAQAAQEERIAASFLLALGRAPSATEVADWGSRDPVPFADLMAWHRRHLREDGAARQVVTEKADRDAFGRSPGDDRAEIVSADGTYADLVRQHLQWLAAHPDAYAQVVHRAYRLVLQRDAYDVELRYWAQQPPLSFALLAACIDDWARRNQPGLMATTGVPAVSVNSRHLTTIRLSPAVAAEARRALGLTPAGGQALSAAVGRHVVAPGAAHLVSVGGIHFAAAGASDPASEAKKN